MNLFKNEKEKLRSLEMHPLCNLILYSLWSFCHDEKIPFTITATKSTRDEDVKLERVSSTHREGRAFDFRTIGLSEVQIFKVIDYLNENFINIAAMGSNGKPALVYRHNNGNGDHLHIQINSQFKV